MATCLGLALAGWLLVSCFSLPSPIYPGDEYAYLRQGLDFPNITANYERDPGLQRLSNYAYFALIRTVDAAGIEPTIGIRMLNYGCLVAATLGLAWVFFGRTRAVSFAAYCTLITALPSSIRVLAVMPELPMLALYTLGTIGTIGLMKRSPNLAAILAAVTTAVLLYIKPHALAILAAWIGYWICSILWIERSSPAHRRFLPLLVYASTLTLFVASLNRILTGHFDMSPRFIGTVYAKTAVTLGTGSTWRTAFDEIFRYALFHLVVLLALFPLATAAMLGSFWAVIQRRSTGTMQEKLALFTLAGTFATIVMVAYFSFKAGLLVDTEGNRLFGRYFMHLFPIYVALSCLVAWPRDPNDFGDIGRSINTRWFGLTWAISLFATWGISRNIHLFPWDYPELFGIFSAQNDYWQWTGPIWPRYAIAVGAIVAISACLAWPRKIASWILAFSLLSSLTSLYATASWQKFHLAANSPASRAAATIADLLGPQRLSISTLVGEDRYGRMANILYGLRGNPFVLATGDAAITRPKQLNPATKFVIADTFGTKIDIPYAASLRVGTLTVYSLSPDAALGTEHPLPLWDRQPFVARLDNDQPNVGLTGFNLPEPWGAWTAQSQGIIRLPFRIYGRLRISFRSWVVQIVPKVDATIVMGSEQIAYHPTASPVEYSFLINVPMSTDRLFVAYPVYRPDRFQRALGVAITNFTITPD